MNKYSALYQIMLLMMFTFLCFILFAAISAFLAIGIYHVNIFSDSGILMKSKDPNVLGAMQMMQTLQAIGAFVVPAVGFAAMASLSKWEYLGESKRPSLILILICSLMVFVAFPFINYMGDWNSKLPFPKWVYESEEQASEMMQAFLNFNSLPTLFFNLFMMAILPAVGEEFLFRGVLQKLLYKVTNNKHIAVWSAAIIFSAFHMQFLGFFPRMILGAMFGYLVIETGSLWYSIAGHFTNNAMGVITIYLINTHQLQEGSDNYGSTEIIVASISCVLMVLLMAAFGVIAKRKSNQLPS
jgi:hypothetical protein